MPDVSIIALGLALILVILLGGVVAFYRNRLAQLHARLASAHCTAAPSLQAAALDARISDWYQNSPIGFHSLDAQGYFTAINDTELRWLGYRREEVVGKMHISDMLTDASKKIMAQSAVRARKEGSSADLEYETIRKDGSTFHVLIHEHPLKNAAGELTGYHLSATDITQRKRSEEALRLSEANFARAQALAQVGHYEIDLADSTYPEGGQWSDETFRILGRKSAAGVLNFRELLNQCIHPDDRAGVERSVRESVTAGVDTNLEFRILHPDHSVRHVKTIGHVVQGKGLRPDKLFGVLMDVTDLNVAQEKIEHNESRFRAMIEKSAETIALFWEDGTFVYASPSISRLLGYAPDELVGQKVWNQIHPDDMPTVVAQLAEIMSVPGSSVVSHFRARHKSGAWRWVESSETNRLQDPEIDAIIANVRDITQSKELELALAESNTRLRELSAYLEEVREKERADIAQALHDEVGQHYAGLQMGIHWLEQRHSGDPASVEKTKLMRELMTRAFGTIRNIIQSLHPPMLDDLGLVGALEVLVEDVTQNSGLNIEFTSTALCEGLPKPHQLALFRGLQEALTNVSRHANANHVRVHLECDADNAVLLIQDNGGGMSSTAREKRGSFGLFGMSERVKTLGGSFEVRSAVGAGTTIRLSVPLPKSTKPESA